MALHELAKKAPGQAAERDPRQIYVATFGLLMSVASYAIPDEGMAGAFFGSGLITAAFCVLYWLANPTGGID